ncbi:ATP-binding cassette domain-containing protein [Actinomadura rubrisoli]|uniref:ATP-binding cassette domain-containing protein n=1 Tax=Actinomadura rubrisoli TaxID=2530368 RepID=A0A4R5AVD7_9ACTN|nr:ATP-binding cassette domain-containing protein [Actinomadura rubrisoli]TDD74552.1 ATP-binding cassette domain-containing protein [Actinomadura rubrisoli]
MRVTANETAGAVVLTGVTKSYGRARAVDGIDLRLDRGTTVALLRPNGAAKSTTIGMMLGLLLPDSGAVEATGVRPVRPVRPARREHSVRIP